MIQTLFLSQHMVDGHFGPFVNSKMMHITSKTQLNWFMFLLFSFSLYLFTPLSPWSLWHECVWQHSSTHIWKDSPLIQQSTSFREKERGARKGFSSGEGLPTSCQNRPGILSALSPTPAALRPRHLELLLGLEAFGALLPPLNSSVPRNEVRTVRRGHQLAQGHTTGPWQSWDQKPGFLTPKILLPT